MSTRLPACATRPQTPRLMHVPVSIRVLFWSGVLLVVGSLHGCRLLKSPDRSSSVPPDSATVLWSGAVTDTSARVTARLPDAPSSVRLVVTSADNAKDSMVVNATHPPASPDVFHFSLSGLTPRTSYQYTLQRNGRLDTTRRGRFRTFGDGPFSFRVALAGCARTGSRHPVFGAIRRAHPDLFLHLGDMHYEDIVAPQPAPFRRAYQQVHSSPPQAALYRSTPLAYMWDDHDYGPNNSSRQAPAQQSARRVYREYVPHYPMAQPAETAPVYQAFTVGRVRFLLTDLRSARTFNEAPDSIKTMMGTRQKRWFKRQLRQARNRYPVIAWVSSVPWIAPAGSSEDHWGGFVRERRELATFIDSIGVANQLVVLSGDAHMVALDDGTHNRYGRTDGGGFPVVHAAALDKGGSIKGGPYTHGPYRNPFSLFGRRPGQYILMDVQDNGEDVCITWTGKRYNPASETASTLLQWDRCFAPPAP